MYLTSVNFSYETVSIYCRQTGYTCTLHYYIFLSLWCGTATKLLEMVPLPRGKTTWCSCYRYIHVFFNVHMWPLRLLLIEYCADRVENYCEYDEVMIVWNSLLWNNVIETYTAKIGRHLLYSVGRQDGSSRGRGSTVPLLQVNLTAENESIYKQPTPTGDTVVYVRIVIRCVPSVIYFREALGEAMQEGQEGNAVQEEMHLSCLSHNHLQQISLKKLSK